MTPIYQPGGYTDVFVLPDGRLGQVAAAGAVVRCYIEGVLAWDQTAPEALLFCRCAVHQGLVLTVHQGQSGRGWLVGPGFARDIGLTFGVQPVAIDARFAYVVRSAAVYDRIDLETAETISLPSDAPESAQGISDVAEDGSLWWADLKRELVVAGATLTYPNRRSGVTVGQADPAAIVAAFGAVVAPVFVGDGFEPHLAVSGDRAAICARTPRGAAYVVIEPAALRTPAPPPPPPPAPKPVPAPAPAPNPKPAPPPRPTPAPVPAPVPSTPLPAAQPLEGASMRVFLKIGPYYIGVSPNAAPGKHGDDAFSVYFNRPGEPNAGGGWETLEATAHDGGRFDVRFVESNRQLSIDQFGHMQTRAAGEIGGDELFFLTSQPDGSNLLYRFQDGKGLVPCVLSVEEA